MKNDSDTDAPLRPPSLRLLLGEARVPLEVLRFLTATRRLQDLPRGDGHPVMLVPGFGADDWVMSGLRRALCKLGYQAVGWEQGRNLGMRPDIRLKLARRLDILHARHQSPVTLIGWSLGGVFVRELARARPQQVRRVITLGSPINGDPEANNMMPLFRLANRGRAPKTDREGFERRKLAPPVPCTAIYTRQDGIVAWQASLEESAPNTENIEVRGTHFGLVTNLEVLRAVASVMASDAKLSDRR